MSELLSGIVASAYINKSGPFCLSGEYVAVSASDKTDDWSLWYVTVRGGKTNILRFDDCHATFACRESCEAIAKHWNEFGARFA